MFEQEIHTKSSTPSPENVQRAPIAPWVLQNTVASYNNIFVQHCYLAPPEEPVRGVVSDDMIMLCLSNTAAFEGRLDGRMQRKPACTGDLIIQPKHVPADYHWANPGSVLHLYIASSLISSVVDDVAKTDTSRFQLVDRFLIQDPLIEQIGLAFLNELSSHTIGSSLYVESLALTLTLHLIRKHSSLAQTQDVTSKCTTSHPFQHATDYINDHLDQNITLTHLAALVHLSPYHFARLFKQQVGLAPHQYIIHCRVERARELLTEGRLSVAEIADRVGFADQSHLARHIKSHLGISPKTLMKHSKNILEARKNAQDSVY